MFLYRGKVIGGQERLTETCLRIISEGDPELILEILPHIRILRSPLYFEPLLVLLKNGDNLQKAAAVFALGSLGDARCIDALRSVYFSRHEGGAVQRAVVAALGEIPSVAAVELLIEIHSDGWTSQESELAEELVVALGQIAQQEVPTAENELIRFLTDPDPAIRSAAVTELSLAYWHRPNSISSSVLHQIFDLAGDPAEEVRVSVAEALTSLAKLGGTKATVLAREVNRRR